MASARKPKVERAFEYNNDVVFLLRVMWCQPELLQGSATPPPTIFPLVKMPENIHPKVVLSTLVRSAASKVACVSRNVLLNMYKEEREPKMRFSDIVLDNEKNVIRTDIKCVVSERACDFTLRCTEENWA